MAAIGGKGTSRDADDWLNEVGGAVQIGWENKVEERLIPQSRRAK